MNILFRVLKWSLGIVMGIFLFICLVDFFGFESVLKMPRGVDDLAWANVTLQEIQKTPSGLSFKISESPATFFATSPISPDNAEHPLKVGDHVFFDIKREDAEHLQNSRGAMVYGLQLSDGSQLFDDSAQIAKYRKFLQIHFFKMSLVPIGYFLIIFYGSALRRKFDTLRIKGGLHGI